MHHLQVDVLSERTQWIEEEQEEEGKELGQPPPEDG